MATTRLVYVVGAGIAGLTAALALAKFGLRVIVLERNAALTQQGAGLQISPNARKILDSLGLAAALRDAAFVPDGIDVWPWRARRPIQTLALGDDVERRFGAPYAVMHRADLATALYAATRPFANIEVLFSVSDIAVTPTGPGVQVRYRQDGRDVVEAPAFALIGADGVHSAIRKTFPDAPDAEPTGATAWRTLATPETLGNGLRLDRVSALLAPRHHMIVYPLPARGEVNLVLLSGRRADLLGDTDVPGQPAPSPHAVVDTLIRRVGADWQPWPLLTHRRHHFGDGPIALVGDAAHAMLPFSAQGAAMGIEDAATLATLLATAPNAAHATRRYRDLRAERVNKVSELSRRNGEIFHMGWPVSSARDAAIAMGGPHAQLRRLAWIYGYEVAGGAAILGPNAPAR